MRHLFAEVCLCPRHDLLLGPDQRRGCAARAEAPGLTHVVCTRMEDKHWNGDAFRRQRGPFPAIGPSLPWASSVLPCRAPPRVQNPGSCTVAIIETREQGSRQPIRQPIRQSETPSRVPIRHLFSRENLMSLRFSLEKRWRISTREGVSDWRIGWRIGWRLPCSCVSILATVQLPRFWSRGGARHGHTELA
jgi:hypothetical protein